MSKVADNTQIRFTKFGTYDHPFLIQFLEFKVYFTECDWLQFFNTFWRMVITILKGH